MQRRYDPRERTQTRRDGTASPRLPGGDLVSALFDREVMGLADRGGASNLIGDRWADVAAAHAATWVGSERRIHADDREPVRIVRVDRLDATPRVAAAASKRGLQNPDLLLIGARNGQRVIQAADAKFSVETARAKQVSPDVVLGLLSLRGHVPGLLEDVDESVHVERGVFLCPDYPLTHLMLRRRHGIVRTTVRREEVIFVPVDAGEFWDEVPGASVMAPLAGVDDLPLQPAETLMAGVYYFRLARAAAGFWLDATKPLLLYNDVVAVDEDAVREEAERRARMAASALALIRRWDSDVQVIRNQRAAVDQVASLPIPGRDLRPMAARIAAAVGVDPPSANQVRRRFGAWYRGELRARLGPIPPPVDDLQTVLQRVAAAGRELAPQAERELERIVLELVAEAGAREAATVSS
ncbi:MAG: hypothetical protein ACRDJC_18575 [Thermomicrobiales bacterium]